MADFRTVLPSGANVVSQTPTSSGGFDLGSVISALAAAGIDIYNLASGSTNSAYNTAISTADPFATSRGMYVDRLNALVPTLNPSYAPPVQAAAAATQGNDFGLPALTAQAGKVSNTNYAGALQQFLANPSSILQTPVFQSALDVGLEGVSRQQGAAAAGASGGRLAALEQYGQTQAKDFIFPYANALQGAGQLQLAGDQAGVGALATASNVALQSNNQTFNQILQGQEFASREQQQVFNNTARLAGVDIGPAQAANLTLGQQGAQTNTAAGLASAAGPLINAVSQLLSGGGGGGISNLFSGDPNAINDIGQLFTDAGIDPSQVQALMDALDPTGALGSLAGTAGAVTGGVDDYSWLSSIFGGP